MKVLARRLGLNDSQVVPADDLVSIFSDDVRAANGKGKNGLLQTKKRDSFSINQMSDNLKAPRDEWIDDNNEPEFDSDDELWSDDEYAVGDHDIKLLGNGSMENLPSSQLDAANIRRKNYNDNHPKIFSAPSDIPALNIPYNNNQTIQMMENEESRENTFGWRRLPRPIIRPGFISNSGQTYTKGPDKLSSNTLNSPLFLVPISPVDACKYIPTEFSAEIDSIFVPNAKKDMERSIATLERNIRREEELSRNLPTDDLLLFGEAKEFTSVDAFMARQNQLDRNAVEDPIEEAKDRAVLAAKSSNIALMEDALASDIPINTADKFGNTLLILAAQQGSKVKYFIIAN
jgi:hypothetical protein